MCGRIVRALALVCGFTLALPPGWCCMVTLPTARGEKAVGGPALPCGCSGYGSAPAALLSSKPDRPPRPRDPGKCCCTDRTTIAPLDTVDVDLTPHPVGRTAADLIAAVTPAPPADIRLAVPLPAVPLFVLDCVWRC